MTTISFELKGRKFIGLGTTWFGLEVKQAILLTKTTQLAPIKALINSVRGPKILILRHGMDSRMCQ